MKKIIVIALVFLLLASCSSASLANVPKPTPTPGPQDAYLACQTFVTNRLKAPSTAVFPDYDPSFSKPLPNMEWHITSYVDSQNGFGAQIRTSYDCLTQYKSSEWILDTLLFPD
jgi:hypothetical protein